MEHLIAEVMELKNSGYSVWKLFVSSEGGYRINFTTESPSGTIKAHDMFAATPDDVKTKCGAGPIAVSLYRMAGIIK